LSYLDHATQRSAVDGGGALRRGKMGLNLAAAILKISGERRSIGRFLLRAARKNSVALDGMTRRERTGLGLEIGTAV